MTTQANDRFLLMELPSELQNMIIELVCSDDVEVRPTVCARRVGKHQVAITKPPSLLLVNKRARLHALKMFYANATFKFEASRRVAMTVKRWLKSVGKVDCHSLVSRIKLFISFAQWQRIYRAPLLQDKANHAQEILESVKLVAGPQVNIEINVWLPANPCSLDEVQPECVWTTEPTLLVQKQRARVDQLVLESVQREQRT